MEEVAEEVEDEDEVEESTCPRSCDFTNATARLKYSIPNAFALSCPVDINCSIS
jgi:hypothetical protein